MLPLRLGTVNANGPQDLIVFALTRHGRVEAINYPNIKTPSGMDVPLYVKDDFGPFYKSIFETVVAKEHMRAAFVEYAWNMGNCDPCAAEPLRARNRPNSARAGSAIRGPLRRGAGSITRMHVRYDAQSFPEDIAFEETADAENFQARYVLRHPWTGAADCPAGGDYRASLPAAFAKQAETLAALTDWPRKEIVARMRLSGQPVGGR